MRPLSMRASVAACVSAIVVALAGCHKVSTTAVPSKPSAPVHWKRLYDGSFASVGDSTNGDFNDEHVERCWPISKGVDCIFVSVSRGDGGMGKAIVGTLRYLKPRYTDPPMTLAMGLGGYTCSRFDDMATETIDLPQGGGTLASNQFLIDQSGSFWTKDYVKSFIETNKVKPVLLWHDCEMVTKLAKTESVVALTSSSLSYEKMNGEAPASID